MKFPLRQAVLLFAALLSATLAQATIGLGLQRQLGNPSAATTDTSNTNNFLLDRAQMSLSYNNTTRDPNWVAWHLTSPDVGTVDRSPFIPDPDLPAGFYAVTTGEYNGVGNIRFDRGHMSPSKDRTITEADNQVVFYMTNIVPQASDNNQGPWAAFEDEARRIADQGNELLIISGPSGFGSTTIPSGVVFTPANVWKIVVVVPLGAGDVTTRINANTRVIALKMPNVNGIRNVPWTDFITSAAEIENDTGYQFFTTLPAGVAAALRVKVDGGGTVGVPPNIIAQPQPQTAVLGGSATFSVGATSSTPLTYQWRLDGNELAGATNAILTLTNIQTTDAGNYDVQVTNSTGSVASNAASLTVALPVAPSFTTHPASQTILAGNNVTFAAAATGVPTPTLQWYKAGNPISGATNTTLVLTNVQPADSANYHVVATNQVSSATSNPAVLTVSPAPPTITTAPVSQSAPLGGSASFSVAASGSAPFTYQWRKNGAAIAGATDATLALSNVQATDAGSYDVLVTNAAASTASPLAVLTITSAGVSAPSTIVWTFGTDAASPTAGLPTSGLPADVTTVALSQGNNNGTTAIFTTTSASTPTSTFSGSVNAGAAARIGPLVTGANGSAYFQFTLQPTGGKQLNVTGLSFGARSTNTGPAAYTILTSLDNYVQPVATGTLTVTGNNWINYTTTLAPISPAAGAPVTIRIYGHSGAGGATANTANWRIDDLKVTVTTAIPGGTVTPTVAIASTSPAANASSVAVGAPVSITFNAPVTVTGSWFTLNSALNGALGATVSGGPTTYTLTPTAAFAHNDTITVQLLAAQIADQATGTGHPTSNYTFAFNTAAPTAPTIGTQPIPQFAVVGGTATFSVTATGTAPLAYQWRKGGVALTDSAGFIAGATTATLTLSNLTLGDAGNYDVVVSNPANSPVASAAAALTVTTSPVAPSILTSPVAQSATTGGSATFSVVATGTNPLAYQWRKDGAPISGATNASLTLTGITPAAIGSYDVVVSNGTLPDAVSAAAALSVSTPGGLSYATYAGGFYIQSFDTLPASGTFGFTGNGPFGLDVPLANGGVGAAGATGWSFAKYAGSGDNASFRTDTGSNTAGGAVSYGSSGAADRALGSVSSGSNTSRYGLMIVNTTGQPITQFTLKYTGEQWRHGGGTTPNKLAFAYAVGGTDINTGTFTTVTALDFTAPIFASGSGALVGNADANRGHVTGTVSGVTWNPGQVLVLRWSDTDDSGADDGLAIDDIVLTTGALTVPTFAAQPVSQSVTFGSPVSFTVEATGTPAPTYQWRKNGTPISGATNATLSFAAATMGDAGSYTCVISNVAASLTSSAATLTVTKAPATVVLGNLAQTYDGTARVATATTTPTGLVVAFTYDGSSTPPTNVGSYAVVATVVDSNYAGSASGTLVVSQATATIAFADLTQTYDGTAKPVTVTTTPAGLATTITYAGSPGAPINAGSYALSAVIANPNYTGSAEATLNIQKAPATVVLGNLSQTYDGTAKSVSVATAPAGLTVAVTYNGSATAPTAAGSYAVLATIVDANRFGAASGTLTIGQATAEITLAGLVQAYDGTPRVVTATTAPAGLDVTLTYNGSATAPTNPGSYAVVATLNNPNYTATKSDTLLVSITALVRRAPTLNGGIVGSVQVLTGESLTLNGSAYVSGDILIPGTPTVRLNGNPTFVGTRDGTGAATPNNYMVTLNGGAALRYLVRRTDAIAMPTVSAPPASTGTRNVSVNMASGAAATIGDFATLRNLTLNGNVGQITVPAGTYGSFTANGGSGFTLGVAGATTPAVYNLQGLTLNGNSELRIVGPVTINLANGTSFNGSLNSSGAPALLKLNVASGSVTLNGNVTFNGYVTAPNGTVTINGSTTLTGGVIADRLTINGNGELRTAP